MSDLNDFFERLGSDAKLLEEYKKDPEGVMKANGISDKDIAIVMSGEEDQLRKQLGDTKSAKAYIMIQANKK
ncbi:hypothetical protein [Shewanella waksmanii]|uniref:hypothetical protein n=1 Tax=Shewanella waksmanii TaxID=213783 RepID=UPI0037353141